MSGNALHGATDADVLHGHVQARERHGNGSLLLPKRDIIAATVQTMSRRRRRVIRSTDYGEPNAVSPFRGETCMPRVLYPSSSPLPPLCSSGAWPSRRSRRPPDAGDDAPELPGPPNVAGARLRSAVFLSPSRPIRNRRSSGVYFQGTCGRAARGLRTTLQVIGNQMMSHRNGPSCAGVSACSSRSDCWRRRLRAPLAGGCQPCPGIACPAPIAVVLTMLLTLAGGDG